MYLQWFFIMELAIKKWGNSAAVRLPSALLDSLNLKFDSRVEVFTQDDVIVIKPIKQESLCLEKLLAGITPDNLHGEVDTGHAVGKEFY
jgi:antitoxin MazE